ncbi:MAG: hypothetical protein A3E98_01675 [Candidatus Doudnabacteria bacterium RIFCSPHIGHO2_12_FULL_48_11]|uniref:Uncharacterized protein n=1 Tax=Candidatus Doudnabacteria bacterium RIFCSPHIGHO2_01_FULL_46_24 TaxID=1817825 RepID=A0A1F5NTD1_9BACT|nr:MAG: hypothetical protein A2720_04725 [Candidatus Doudnabacteria bacterium RIFCSPHIGHO2_01_FULL_46_24]OGE95855.1 MAG: hypothetical protein A3E98_01675 [Candidatus Doudnabacteria bacterium RIFCSPHIGHO2_12_FULL_48_11]
MDILQIIKPKIKPLKASFASLSVVHKLIILLILASLISLIIPHTTYASAVSANGQGLIFFIGDHEQFLQYLSEKATQKYAERLAREQYEKQQRLTGRVTKYLAAYGSPLTDTVPTLITLKNWKKIVALSNAESTLCRKYPKTTANCWGIGGSTLWDMGDNLTEGVVAMNRFLENYPKGSKIKYARMTFEQMNGLYKQPPMDHWVENNEVIYQDLLQIEQSI